VQSVYERYVQLQACRYIDEILVYETEQDLLNLLMTQNINIRFLGDEYREKNFTGKQYCMDHGIELYYHPRRHPFSSTQLRNRVFEMEKEKRELPQPNAPEQHSPFLLDKYLDAELNYSDR
jgi:glycerol-3-phosphate cytidylyltransferase